MSKASLRVVAAAVAFHNDMVAAFEERGHVIGMEEVMALHDAMQDQRRNVGWALGDGDPEQWLFGRHLTEQLLSTWRWLCVMAARRHARARPQPIDLPAWAQTSRPGGETGRAARGHADHHP